jgi:Concanavalin A-like lectin/glucanases superfamily/PEP-CTERM motif
VKSRLCILGSAGLAILLGSSEAALVARYNFDGNTNDQSGMGNNGALMNGATYSNDTPFPAGSSLSLGDGQQHVLVPHNASLDITETMTISAWVKPQGIAFEGLLAKSPSNGSNPNHAGNYELRIESGSNQMHFLYQQGGANDTAFPISTDPAAIVGANQWTHIAVTVSQIGVDPGEVKYYQNGVLVDTKAINPGFGATNTNPLYIGSRADLFTQWHGQIDDLRIYNTALSDAEIGLLALIPEPSTGLIAAAALGLLGLSRRRGAPVCGS